MLCDVDRRRPGQRAGVPCDPVHPGGCRGGVLSGAVPGVEVANYFTNRPYGSDPSEVKLIQMFAVDYDYLALYSPEMLCGRGFSETYGNERNKVVLNEEAVRLLGYPSPDEALGKQLAMEVLEEPLEVVGVVKNYHQQSLAEPYKPILFFPERAGSAYCDSLYIRQDGWPGQF